MKYFSLLCPLHLLVTSEWLQSHAFTGKLAISALNILFNYYVDTILFSVEKLSAVLA